MYIEDGIPVVSLCMDIYTYDSTKEDYLGTFKEIVLVDKKRRLFIRGSGTGTSSPVAITNNKSWYNTRVDNAYLLGDYLYIVEDGTSYSFFDNINEWYPTNESITLLTFNKSSASTLLTNYTFKWYNRKSPNTYLAVHDRLYVYVKDGVVVDRSGNESGYPFSWTLSSAYIGQQGYSTCVCGTYDDTTGLYAYGYDVTIRRYQNSVYAEVKSINAPNALRVINAFLNDLPDYAPPSSDPYSEGGTTDIGGGTGTFDGTTEPVPVPDIPTTSAVDTGFISLYNPSIAQLKALASYLWSPSGLDLDTFKKIFSDAMSAILGLSLIPLAPGAGTVESVILGNIDTGVTMPRISSQFIKYSCGSLTIEEYWGGYLDYSPYTSAEIYLPFIGVKPLSIDDIMGKTIAVWYLIDVLSGGCVACIDCAGAVLYQFIGQCACTIPVTGRDFSSVVNGVLGAIGSGVSGFLKGGISGGVLGAVGSLAGNVTSMKPHVEKSGNMGGMGGMLGVKTPYIILTRPKQALPANQNTYTGYPSYITSVLGECSGYTVVQDVHLTGFPATDDEKEEILRLLKEGVYL